MFMKIILIDIKQLIGKEVSDQINEKVHSNPPY